jgi:hypothetical protein
MGKYIVRCYYEYVGKVAVEADSFDEACDKGLKLCEDMTTDDLYFCGGTIAEVQDENGGIEQFSIG